MIVKPAPKPTTEPDLLDQVEPENVDELEAELQASHDEAMRGELVSGDAVLDDVRRILRGEALTS